MTTTTHRNRQTLAALSARRRQERGVRSPAPRLRPQLIADAVVANYIHDISIRHRRQPPRARLAAS